MGMMNGWNPLKPLRKRPRRTRGNDRPVRPKTLLEVFNTCDSCKTMIDMGETFVRLGDRIFCGSCGIKETDDAR